jgi:hypothetical protein
MPAETLATLRQSHIDGNVPSPGQFDALMQRDLVAYFSDLLGDDVSVSYEMLRKAPTQSGVAAPKYYVWATIYSSDGGTRKGALRLAAIGQTSFAVTDFLPAEDIRSARTHPGRVFPQALVPRILELAAQP